MSEESTTTDTLYHTYHASPVWTSGEFVGTMYRLFEGNPQASPSLLAQVDQSAGGFDTAIRPYYTIGAVDSVDPSYGVEADYSITVSSGSGFWVVGPKVNVNFDGYPTDWYENYIVDNSSRSPSEFDTLFVDTYDATYLGKTTHNGGVYKHYHLLWATWHQIWAVRQQYRLGGRTDIASILRYWRTNGIHNMPNHDVNEIRLNFETSGSINMSVNITNALIPADYATGLPAGGDGYYREDGRRMAKVFVMGTANTRLIDRAEIVGIVWVGATVAGNAIVLKEIGGSRLWEGKASGTATYQGINFSPDDPLLAPNGVEFDTYSNGTVYLYLKSR